MRCLCSRPDRYDTYGGLAFGTTAALTVYFNIGPGLAAIVLVQTQTLILNIYHFVNLYVLVESDFNAIERIQELIDLPSGERAAATSLFYGIDGSRLQLQRRPAICMGCPRPGHSLARALHLTTLSFAMIASLSLSFAVFRSISRFAGTEYYSTYSS